jgi:hypothetical protein
MAAGEVGPEVGVPLAVLAVRAVADAVGEGGLEAVVVLAAHVGADVEDHPRHLLANALAQEARLLGTSSSRALPRVKRPVS